MRRHAKAATAGSTQRRAGEDLAARGALHGRDGSSAPSPTRRLVFAVLALLCLGALFAAPSFGATVTNERPLLFSFDGSDTTAGKLSVPRAIEIDQANGLVYVVDQGNNVLDKFNLAGVAQSFSDTGSSSLAPAFPEGGTFNELSDVAVDNSSTNPGRIYLMREPGPVKAFSPAGASLWELGGFSDGCGLAVDAAGHPWVGDYSANAAREFAATGSPPAEIGSVPVTSGNVCRLDVDASGNVYVNRYGGGVDKYESGLLASTLDSTSSNGVTADQSSASGHVFTIHFGDFNEYEANGTLVNTFGSTGSFIGNGSGIAYDKALDRVYVADAGGAVLVFGPAASGTVPDATIEAPSEVEVSRAKASGKVNPLSLPNSSYHFEWKQGTGSSWASAKSSPSTSLPVETNEIPVSRTLTGLRSNTTYQVRLATTNEENKLSFYSGAETFTTAAPSGPPTASLNSPTVTANSAHLTGTIDPQEDETTWWIEKSTDPACIEGFSSEPTQTIPSEEPGSVNIESDLTGLLSSQHYCVRIVAENGAGSITSSVVQFTTEDVIPVQAFTAYAAPRTDTTARLNGYVNPQGALITYHFEYSEDGGSTWIPLPDKEDTSEAHRQIVVGEELTGLQPNTTYQYRFFAEDSAGSASPQGTTKEFTTRTTPEMTLEKRGYELVNQPDKGDQNIGFNLPFSGQKMVNADGEKALWTLTAGAPGSNNGVYATYLATRTPNGWQNKSVIPLPANQFGGGHLAYRLNESNADFTKFLFHVTQTGAFSEGPPTFVSTDDQGNEDVLHSFGTTPPNEQTYALTEMTEDLKHVLFVSPDTEQLEAFGSGSPELVSVMPDGSPSECGLNTQGPSFTGVTGSPGAASSQWRPGYLRMARGDASRVYFQAIENGGPCLSSSMGIYFRDRDTEETIRVDDGTGKNQAAIIRANPDGRMLYFVTSSSHSPADTNGTGDIYRWNSESGQYTCLTCVVAEAAVEITGSDVGGPFLPVLVSDDFSHVYFLSRKQLIPGEGNAGDSNLYVLSNGELRFVVDQQHVNAPTSILDNFGEKTVELTPDGNVLVFRTNRETLPGLTADQIASECPEMNGQGTSCEELYRYEDSTRSLECISCNHEGMTQGSFGSPGKELYFGANADGSTVAFVTAERLVPEDVNGTYDIYEWHNGKVGLVSDGETIYPSEGTGLAPKVYGIDQSGKNIFFTLADPHLTGYEQDELVNLYDARIGGGFPRPQATVHCVEEACQGANEPAPSSPTPGSTSFNGPGNQPPARKRSARCSKKRGRARQRCLHRVKKHKQKKRHAKKRSGNRHAGGSK